MLSFAPKLAGWFARLRQSGPAHLALGAQGEWLAVAHLKKEQHKILRRNFRAPHGGEVDIVSRDKVRQELVFTEVKTRTSDQFGDPAEAVDQKKRQLILRGAMAWLRLLDMPDLTFRFDIVEVLMHEPPEIHHIRDAFPLPDRYSY